MKPLLALLTILGPASASEPVCPTCPPQPTQQITQLDILYIRQQTIQFDRLSQAMVYEGLKSQDYRIKAAAAAAAGKRTLFITDLLTLVTDQNNAVRQAARYGLICVSRSTKTKIDFGPPPGADQIAAKASQAMWTAWWIERLNKGK